MQITNSKPDVREKYNFNFQNKLMTYIGFLTALYLNDSKVTSGQMRHVLESIESVLPAAVFDQQVKYCYYFIRKIMACLIRESNQSSGLENIFIK